MSRYLSVETVIESLLPALYNLHGATEASKLAHQAADCLVSLIDTGALHEADSITSSAGDFLNLISLDPDLMEQDAAVSKVLMAAIDASAGHAKQSYPQIADATGLTVGAVRRSVSRLRQHGYFTVAYPTQKELDAGDRCLRYRPDMRTRILL
jgi:hypothetical protein